VIPVLKGTCAGTLILNPQQPRDQDGGSVPSLQEHFSMDIYCDSWQCSAGATGTNPSGESLPSPIFSDTIVWFEISIGEGVFISWKSGNATNLGLFFQGNWL
jgi:hypothetical protein